jgi:SsrA-binding protein
MVFFNEKNLVKVEIGLGRGKKLHDKRETERARTAESEARDAIRASKARER